MPNLRRIAAHRGRMPRQRKARHLGEPVAGEAQDVDVALDEISHIEEMSVGAEGKALGESTDRRLRHLSYNMIQLASASGNAAALVFFLFDLLFLENVALVQLAERLLRRFGLGRDKGNPRRTLARGRGVHPPVTLIWRATAGRL